MLFIRAATRADICAILELERRSSAAAHWNADQYVARMREDCLLIATQDKTIRGFVCAHVIGSDWEIENIVVEEEYRRQGIAAALMEVLTGTCRSRNGERLLLEVRESNEAARSFYRKLGFRESGRRPGYYRNPDEDAILYEKHVDRLTRVSAGENPANP